MTKLFGNFESQGGWDETTPVWKVDSINHDVVNVLDLLFWYVLHEVRCREHLTDPCLTFQQFLLGGKVCHRVDQLVYILVALYEPELDFFNRWVWVGKELVSDDFQADAVLKRVIDVANS